MKRGGAAFEALVAAHHARVPPRTGSLLVTVFGVVALPSGQAIRLADLQEWFGHLGIEAGLVRTALSRLVSDGTLLRERDGKAALYRLSAAAEAGFRAAGDRIFGRALPEITGRMELLLIEEPGRRAALRTELASAGFVSLASFLLLRPEHRGRECPLLPGTLPIMAEADAALAARAGQLWPLAALAEGYRIVEQAARGLHAEAGTMAPETAFLARILLVHEFRRIILRDPFLPALLLPADWPAARCRTEFSATLAALEARIDGQNQP